jgi:hypothetical protein
VDKEMQDFINMLPRAVLKKLPPIYVHIQHDPSGSSRGSYDSQNNILSLNAALLSDPKQRKITLYHEMMHWVHLNDNGGAFEKAIADHFAARTQKEKIVALKGYLSATGKPDGFWDTYMGRIYGPGPAQGSEIPTRTIELLLKDPQEFADLWKIPRHRETIEVALSILFP